MKEPDETPDTKPNVGWHTIENQSYKKLNEMLEYVLRRVEETKSLEQVAHEVKYYEKNKKIHAKKS